MLRVLLVSLVFVFAWSTAAADTLRCGGDLVQRGDRTWDVRELCGEPDLKEPVDFAVRADGAIVTTVERWYYNRGPRRLVRMVDFRDGQVSAVRTGGYGYTTFPGSDCRARLIRRGMTRMELLGECGPPAASQVIHPAFFRQAAVPVREEWLYEFGTGRFARIVTLERGRVIRVERGRRQ